MNREFLKELGLTDEQIEATMKEHGKTIQSVKPDDYEELKGAKATYEQQLADLQNTLAAKEEELNSVGELKKENESLKLNELKTNVARQAGIPFEMANRLSGTTEEELKADAENVAGFFSQKQTLPLATTEPVKVDTEEKAYASMLDNLNLKGE